MMEWLADFLEIEYTLLYNCILYYMGIKHRQTQHKVLQKSAPAAY